VTYTCRVPRTVCCRIPLGTCMVPVDSGAGPVTYAETTTARQPAAAAQEPTRAPQKQEAADAASQRPQLPPAEAPLPGPIDPE
jgi:hypothetical protein